MNRTLLAVAFGCSVALADQAPPVGTERPSLFNPPPPKAGPPRAWMGFQLEKPDVTIVAHLPELPRGVGFIVRSLTPGSPAEEAGLEKYDLVWKFDDQLLVNEAQLAVLLRLRNPGDTVQLGIFRGGKPRVLEVRLRDAPKANVSAAAWMADHPVIPAEYGPMRVVNTVQKKASYSNDEGSAEVTKNETGFQIRIIGPGNAVVHEGPLDRAEDFTRLPRNWQTRAVALRRGLEQVLSGSNHPASPQPAPPRIAPSAARAE